MVYNKKKANDNTAGFLETISNKTNYVMSQKMHDVLIGTLLGDGNLSSTQKGETWSYRCLQSKKQRDYLFHKYSIFQDWCLTSPAYQEIEGPNGNMLKRWYFNTRRLHILKPYGNLFYTYDLMQNAWIKKVPLNIDEYLTPTALAYWYMDDGDQKWKGHSKAVRLSTQGFTLDDCTLLSEALIKKYDLKVSLQKDGKNKAGNKQYRIYIGEKSYATLKTLIFPEFVPSMLYKFP